MTDFAVQDNISSHRSTTDRARAFQKIVALLIESLMTRREFQRPKRGRDHRRAS